MPRLQELLASSFASSLADSLLMMTGARPDIAVSLVAPDAALPEPGAWWEQQLSLSPDPAVFVGAANDDMQRLVRRVLADSGITDADEAMERESWAELLSQALAGAARALTTELKNEVTCTKGNPGAPPGAPAARWRLVVSFPDDPQPVTIHLAASAALGTRQIEKPPGEDGKRQPDCNEQSLELLFDIEMPVSVSFGRTKLSIKDVLKLNVGSIVELDRTLNEPVDVTVNNCLVARGEVVVVDGNYGVRVLQVLGRRERMQLLR